MKTILSTLLIITSTTLFAQGLQKEYKASCDCNVITNHYDDGQVSSVHHESVNGTRTGKETVYYPSGQVQYERAWLNGKLNGEGTHFHRNGSLHYSEFYENGKKAGTWTFYGEDGTPVQAIHYNGQGSDGIYEYYHAGIKYLVQSVEGGRQMTETILNQEIYDLVKQEAEAGRDAKK